MENEKIITSVTNYYNEKLQTFGVTPRGVDWNSLESQEIRFCELIKVINPKIGPFSLLDYGCGFGSMFPFMKKIFDNNFSYIGYDISLEMVQKARELYKNKTESEWINHNSNLPKVDYVVASGIFNVRLHHSDNDWSAYILDILQEFNRLSEKGFAFNMLTSYSDKEYMRDYLYYGNPSFFFEYCKNNFSRHVALLHDSPLYEFTILVKKKQL